LLKAYGHVTAAVRPARCVLLGLVSLPWLSLLFDFFVTFVTEPGGWHEAARVRAGGVTRRPDDQPAARAERKCVSSRGNVMTVAGTGRVIDDLANLVQQGGG
jgi:hypothetical protein